MSFGISNPSPFLAEPGKSVLDTISVPGLERAAGFVAHFVQQAAKASPGSSKATRIDINPPKP